MPRKRKAATMTEISLDFAVKRGVLGSASSLKIHKQEW
jgi:hypothetical protein